MFQYEQFLLLTSFISYLVHNVDLFLFNFHAGSSIKVIFHFIVSCINSFVPDHIFFSCINSCTATMSMIGIHNNDVISCFAIPHCNYFSMSIVMIFIVYHTRYTGHTVTISLFSMSSVIIFIVYHSRYTVNSGNPKLLNVLLCIFLVHVYWSAVVIVLTFKNEWSWYIYGTRAPTNCHYLNL